MNKDFKHVCFKDLEDYFKRSDYFSNLTEDEKQEIRMNLGVSSYEMNSGVYRGSYKYIKEFMNKNKLIVGNIYIIEDFLTIYQLDEEVMGTNDSSLPSEEGVVILIALSSSEFVKDGFVIYGKNSYLIQFDILPVKYGDIYSKGTILYMKDSNNNYAYYDFKNIRFKRKASDLNKYDDSYTNDLYFYTFDSGLGVDASNTMYNNHLEKNATNIVFLKAAQNNILELNCNNITFLLDSKNNHFFIGSENVIFTKNVLFCKGIISNKILDKITDGEYPKQFYIDSCVYYDPITQTLLTENI